MAVAIMELKMKRSRVPVTNRYEVAQSTSPDTSSGWRRQSSWAMGPPIE